MEQGEALTADWLEREYLRLAQVYHGPGVTLDPELKAEWSRIPHFFYNFYVYKYATGFCAAVAFVQRFRAEGQKAVEAYLELFRSGGSDYPLVLLARAGVDLLNAAANQRGDGDVSANCCPSLTFRCRPSGGWKADKRGHVGPRRHQEVEETTQIVVEVRMRTPRYMEKGGILRQDPLAEAFGVRGETADGRDGTGRAPVYRSAVGRDDLRRSACSLFFRRRTCPGASWTLAVGG